MKTIILYVKKRIYESPFQGKKYTLILDGKTDMPKDSIVYYYYSPNSYRYKNKIVAAGTVISENGVLKIEWNDFVGFDNVYDGITIPELHANGIYLSKQVIRLSHCECSSSVVTARIRYMIELDQGASDTMQVMWNAKPKLSSK